MRPSTGWWRLGRGRCLALALFVTLGACADRETVRLELESARERMRVGLGNLGPTRSEAALRAAELPATARRHRVGDRFVYSGERVHEVVEVEGQIVVWDVGNDRQQVATFNPAFPVLRDDSRRYMRLAEVGGDPPAGLWPLGGAARQVYNAVVRRTEHATGETRRFGSRLECDSPAPVTVDGPLGPDTAVPVTCRYFSGRRLNQRRVQSFDMVPALGHWVRHVETDMRGEVRREMELLGIEPGPWLAPPARQRLGAQLRQVLEERQSSEVVPFADPTSGLEGLIMATATFVDGAGGQTVCRSYTLTIVDGAADGRATDYPGRSCRDATGWSLPAGF